MAGGRGGDNHILSCVEVLNTGSNEWYTGPPTPTPWYRMKTVVANDVGYFMGGSDSTASEPTMKVYGVHIPSLISHITSKASVGTDGQIWKELPGLQLGWFAPLSIRGSLLAVGGTNEDSAVTAIHLYRADREGVWVKVGDLPSPRCVCTCAMISDRELVVVGGVDSSESLERADIYQWMKTLDSGQLLKRVDLALLA